MSKLGYTFYPKDWGNDDEVFELTLSQRGFYRELIDMAMLNDNKTVLNVKTWARKLNSTIKEVQDILDVLGHLKLIIINSKNVMVPSCEKRLNLIRGGRKGGSKKKPTTKPIIKPIPKPTSNQIETEIETKDKVNKKKDIHNFAYDIIKKEKQSELEIFEMQNKKSFPDYEKFIENFNNRVVIEKLAFEPNILLARLRMLNTNWDKKPKSEKKEITSDKVISKLAEYGTRPN